MDTKSVISWPVDVETIRSFAVWCLEKKNLQVDTVRAYISSVTLAHTLKNLQCPNFSKDKILKLILDGAKNLQNTSSQCSNNRRAASIYTLLLIGHRIAISGWSDCSKIVFWSLCTVAFFTSARLGELLSKSERFFDATSDLLWKDVMFNKNHIILFLKNAKIKNKNGDYLDIFAFNDSKCCPVLALQALKNFQVEKGYFDVNQPVFRFDSGKNLTQTVVNNTLKLLLSDIYVPGENKFTGHSLRAGIPSKLAAVDAFKGEQIAANWGRWASNSVKSYCRLKTSEKSMLFDFISDVLKK
jgi:hypothetical protein